MLQEVLVPADEVFVAVEVTAGELVASWALALLREDDNVDILIGKLFDVDAREKLDVTWVIGRHPRREHVSFDNLWCIVCLHCLFKLGTELLAVEVSVIFALSSLDLNEELVLFQHSVGVEDAHQ